MPQYKHPKVFYKKLGKQQAWGMYHSEGVIELDPRLKGEKKLEIIVHEEMHHIFPDMTEEEVTSKAAELANFLYLQGLRFTE